MEYEKMLYEEYIKTLNSPNKSLNILKEGFLRWLEERQNILPLYEKFLETFDLTSARGIVEIDKTEKDSVLPYTPVDTKGILVSKYINTKKTEKKGIMNVSGKIIVVNNSHPEFRRNTTDILLDYKNSIINISYIKNYITQFPIDDDTLELMINLMNTDNNVFIGTYGKLNDKNRYDNLKKLYDLKQDISKFLNKNLEGEVVYTKDYYLSAITPKLKYKGKSR